MEGLWGRRLLVMLLLVLRRRSIRARRRPLLEQRRREAASLTALVLTRRATGPGVVVEHIAEIHDGGASRLKNDLNVSCVLLAGGCGLCACSATTLTRWTNLMTHPGDGDATSVRDSSKNGGPLMVY